jgi:chromosome segregation ATPase
MTNKQLEKTIEIMKEEKKGLENSLMKSKDNTNEIEKDLRRAKLDLTSANESNLIMQQEHKLLSDDLTQRLNDLHVIERKRTELEKELYELRPLKTKLHDFESQLEEILSKKTKCDSEINRL